MVRDISSISRRKIVQLLMRVDGKEARGIIQQAADGVDRVERS